MNADLAAAAEALPLTVKLLESGREEGLHSGWQLYVSQHGRRVADIGAGEAQPGVPMTADTLMPWLSAGKPLTAVLILLLEQAGQIGLDQPVAEWLPDFAVGGKQAVTVRHLLTHTSGFPNVATGWPEAGWVEAVRRCCAAPLERDFVPGESAGYHIASSWVILGALLEKITGGPFSQHLQETLCRPLGMTDTFNGLSAAEYAARRDRVGWMWQVERKGTTLIDWHQERPCCEPSPGGNTRGPIRELGRFYEALLAARTDDESTRWNWDHVPAIGVLTRDLCRQLCGRQRIGRFDTTFQHVIDFGLGVILDSNCHGRQTVPYGYGSRCSPTAFGHGGSQSSIGFVDPLHGLVVAWVTNGRPGEARHQRRSREINTAIYADLSGDRRNR